jgi:putative tricarboxylic transport membrane protein
MHETDSRKSDILIGAVILTFCSFAAWRTALVRAAPTGTVAGPAFVPWLVIASLVVLSLWLIARALLRYRLGNSEKPIELPARGTLIRMGFFSLLMVAYAAAFMKVGYLPSTWVAFVLGLVLFGERRILVLAFLPPALTLAVYYAFTHWLNVWLPS